MSTLLSYDDGKKMKNDVSIKIIAADSPNADKKSQDMEFCSNLESRKVRRDLSREELEAYATSTAIMGETVFDSPNCRSRDIVQPTDFEVCNHLNHFQSATDAQSFSVGIMAQGLSWARRQRDRRRRMHLQNQAEVQLQKICKAQTDEKNTLEEPTRSLMDNSTFKSIMRIAKALDPEADRNKQNKGNSQGNQSSKNTENDNVDMKISKSESGGYSVSFPIPLEREEEDDSWVPPVRIQQTDRDRIDAVSVPYVLSVDEMQQIACNVLPRGIVYCPWQRLYSLARDGDSFDSFLRLIGSERQTLVVVRTKQNEIFGGFADSPWQQSAHYFGGSSACLFRFDKVSPSSQTIPFDDPRDDYNPRTTVVRSFKWTGANHYVQLCDPNHKMIAFGGGGDDGAFGLCIEQDFQIGSTGPCATFDNESLCEQGCFDVVDMEVWGFLLGQF